MSADAVNAALVALWEQQDPPPTLWPMMYEDIKPNGFISVGLNPSFSADKSRGWNHLRSVPELARLWESPRAHFTWNPADRSNFELATALLAERSARERHQFFAPLRQLHESIAKTHPMDWHHMDVFFLRETDSLQLEDRLFVRTLPKGPAPGSDTLRSRPV